MVLNKTFEFGTFIIRKPNPFTNTKSTKAINFQGHYYLYLLDTTCVGRVLFCYILEMNAYISLIINKYVKFGYLKNNLDYL